MIKTKAGAFGTKIPRYYLAVSYSNKIASPETNSGAAFSCKFRVMGCPDFKEINWSF
jgi:hypothetical protein